MENILRSFFLFLSSNKLATKLARKFGLKLGAKKFVSGESLLSAIGVTKKLNDKNMMATLDHLGEFVASEEEAKESTDFCIQTLEQIYRHQLNANLSLKLTQLGMDISREITIQNMKKILEVAKRTDNFVRIDMEDYERNEKTLGILKELREEYGEYVGVVIQAYLYKSEKDVKELGKEKTNLRLCKGAYKESKKVAYPDKKDVDENFMKLIKTHLKNNCYTGIATHDEKIITEVKEFVQKEGVPLDKFEFQMLYGIQNHLLEELSKEGYRTRVYIPFGKDWYGYFMRRLAERPANVWFVLKNIKKKKNLPVSPVSNKQ